MNEVTNDVIDGKLYCEQKVHGLLEEKNQALLFLYTYY